MQDFDTGGKSTTLQALIPYSSILGGSGDRQRILKCPKNGEPLGKL